MKLRVFWKYIVMKMVMPDGYGKDSSFLCAVLFLLFSGLFSGCGNKFFDPSQVGRFRPVPAVNVILDSLGVAEETPVAWEGAEEPLPVDSMVTESDYVFMSGDVISVVIFELLQEGVQYANSYVVTETGKISIPEVGVIQAAGLTETQLEDKIRRILSPSILKEPSVTVALGRSQQRAFSVLGDGVPLPGRYFIPRYNFRLTDALATAGGPRQFNVSYIYISRFAGGNQNAPDSINPGFGELELKVIEPQTTRPVRQKRNNVMPRAEYQWPKSDVVISSSEMASDREYSRTPSNFGQFNDATSRWLYAKDVGISNGRPPLQDPVEEPASVEEILKMLSEYNSGETSSPQEPASRQRVNIQDTSRPSVAPSRPQGTGELLDQTPKPMEPAIKMGPAEQLAVPPQEGAPVIAAAQEGAGTRLIRIPADKLLAGDPRYNIVIKSGDSIFVPVDIVGEFCIMGNVNRTGYIPLTGRPMTLKQAIAAAGGLGPLAWPKRCEVIRRIGRKKEEIVMVDLDKIASGEQPDFFIKPHDLINVGTHATARWRAILRNAFRATYGFGFVYDRNFADRDFGTSRPIPDWF